MRQLGFTYSHDSRLLVSLHIMQVIVGYFFVLCSDGKLSLMLEMTQIKKKKKKCCSYIAPFLCELDFLILCSRIQ